MSPLQAVMACIVGPLVITVAFYAAFALGVKRGRDAQWCDDWFAGVEADRARRDHRGRFTSFRGTHGLWPPPKPRNDRLGGN